MGGHFKALPAEAVTRLPSARHEPGIDHRGYQAVSRPNRAVRGSRGVQSLHRTNAAPEKKRDDGEQSCGSTRSSLPLEDPSSRQGFLPRSIPCITRLLVKYRSRSSRLASDSQNEKALSAPTTAPPRPFRLRSRPQCVTEIR